MHGNLGIRRWRGKRQRTHSATALHRARHCLNCRSHVASPRKTVLLRWAAPESMQTELSRLQERLQVYCAASASVAGVALFGAHAATSRIAHRAARVRRINAVTIGGSGGLYCPTNAKGSPKAAFPVESDGLRRISLRLRPRQRSGPDRCPGPWPRCRGPPARSLPSERRRRSGSRPSGRGYNRPDGRCNARPAGRTAW